MITQNRLALARQLRRKQAQIAQRNPNLFAANRIVKALSTSHPQQRAGAPLRKLRTASVFYDKKNAATGNAITEEFRRRGIQTQSLGLIGENTKIMPTQRKAISKMSRAESVVFLTGAKRSQFDAAADLIVERVEARKKTKLGSRLAMMYGIEDSASRRTLAATAREAFLTRRFTRKTMQAIQGARTVKVMTPSGTNLVFSLSQRNRWVADEGIMSKNYWGNLPAGEVFTAPLSVNGIVVIDGTMVGIGRTNKTPIKALIRNGRVVMNSISCPSEGVKRKFIEMLQKDRNASRVGELGLGTNVTIKRLLGNDLVDEKIPGVHLAFGDPYTPDTHARWESDVHNDAILTRPTILVDGKAIMRNGKSLLRK